ncbi:MAG: tRNA (adenosine(37)-N6)-dimethylallyltransferase MiaA [Deltaproteobacteria bacterium]|nr:tRNA (adenosine(37)-N6)-dimethylallyltransferase MiaA [Deltaproteobacteria bacterium]
MSKRPKVVIISGPTASGKTSLGVDLALVFNGEIISADSMQVYRGMDVGTAKPTPEEQKGIPHHLLDVVDPDEEFNAATYNSMAIPKITEIGSRGSSCFVVGGTGLYIKGLLDGFFECPPADMELRESLRRKCDSSGLAVLHKRLADLDPESAHKIHPNDRVRIIRALEIIYLTNRRFSDLTREHTSNGRTLNALKLCLEVDREELYSRIDKRSLAMVENGLVDEAESLLRKGYSPDLKPMKAIGYRHMITYLKGDWSLDEAISELQKDTRRYAKRQLTWFRADPEVTWIEPGNFHMFKDKAREFLIETA